MNIQTELLSLAGAKKEIEDRANKMPLVNEFYESLKTTVRYQDEELLKVPYQIVKSIDRKMQKGIISKKKQARIRRKIFLSVVLGRMIRFEMLCPDILKNEGIGMDKLVKLFALHFHSTSLITEAIVSKPFIQKKIKQLAKTGKSPNSIVSGVVRKTDEILSPAENTSRKNLFRQYVDSKNEQTQEDELLKEQEEKLLNGSIFPIEDICYSIVYGSKFAQHEIDFEWREGKMTTDRIWRLSTTAHIKLIGLIVKAYNHRYKKQIVKSRNEKRKDRQSEWSRKNNIKVLSAQDKKRLVQEGKDSGLTQIKVAEQIGCSVRTVQSYWNTDKYMNITQDSGRKS